MTTFSKVHIKRCKIGRKRHWGLFASRRAKSPLFTSAKLREVIARASKPDCAIASLPDRHTDEIHRRYLDDERWCSDPATGEWGRKKRVWLTASERQ